MEPLLIIVVPGVFGGLLAALVIARFHVPPGSTADWPHLAPPSPGHINMAHIRVDGVGGLGLVAMAAAVAIYIPSIRLAMVTGLLLGAALGAVLIAVRRRSDPLPSSNRHPGAHSSWWVGRTVKK